MTKFKTQGLGSTFKNARKGVRLAIKSERNIRIHLVVAIFVIAFASYLKFSPNQFCGLITAITSVVAAEMFNAAIEFSLDSIYHNKYSRMVGMAKDIAAGAVLLVTLNAILVGCILFVPKLIELFG